VRTIGGFRVGEQVRISWGPLRSFSGVVDEVDEENAKLQVAVLTFGRARPIEIAYAEVEKLQG